MIMAWNNEDTTWKKSGHHFFKRNIQRFLCDSSKLFLWLTLIDRYSLIFKKLAFKISVGYKIILLYLSIEYCIAIWYPDIWKKFQNVKIYLFCHNWSVFCWSEVIIREFFLNGQLNLYVWRKVCFGSEDLWISFKTSSNDVSTKKEFAAKRAF